jgi:hypothetical protein
MFLWFLYEQDDGVRGMVAWGFKILGAKQMGWIRGFIEACFLAVIKCI